MLKSILLILSVSMAAVLVNANDPSKFRVVPDDRVLEQLAKANGTAINSQFDALVWNVKKADQKEVWRADLQKLAVGTSFVLLQEGMQDDYMPTAIASLADFGWTMAKTFFMNIDQDATGVITGSILNPVSSDFLRSRDLEPLIKTPKISLLTTYKLADGSSLLVINIHAINFQTPAPFYRQIDDIITYVSTWNGKILFAGDFNTWIPARLKYLIEQSKTVGLIHVEFAVDPRPIQKKLDHVFLKGCTATKAELLTQITSSDHPPIKLNLDCSH